jgi:hypothetical protein
VTAIRRATSTDTERRSTSESTSSLPARTFQSGPTVFAVLLVAGLIVRVLVLRTTWSQPDATEAYGMLMAQQAAHGHFSLLFWGAASGGTLVTFIEAPFVAVFGLHLWVIHVIDMALTLVCVFLLRAVGRRFLAPVAADVAAGTFWFFPANWLFWSSKEYVFWLPAIAFALATCLFVLRWFDSRSRSELWKMGACAGLSLWSYGLVFPLIAPALVIFVWAERKHGWVLLRAAFFALLGVSPWLAYFVIHGSSDVNFQAAPGGRISQFRATITQLFPSTFLGGQRRVDVLWTGVNPSLTNMKNFGALTFMAIVLVAVIVLLRREVAVAACAASVLLWPFALLASHVPAGTATYRYGLILVAPVLLMAAYVLSKARVVPLLGVGALALVVATTWSDTSGFAAAPQCNASVGVVTDYLVSQHRTDVWAAYWLSSPIDVCSNQRVVAAAVTPALGHAAQVAALAAPRSTYVVFAGNELDVQINAWATRHPGVATRTTAGGYAVWELDHKVTPAEMGLSAAF